MSFTTSWIMEVVDQSSGAMASIGEKAEQMGSQIEASAERSSISLRDVGTSMSGVASSAFALYSMYDRVERSSYTLDRAQNLLGDTQRRVQDAQEAYNKALSEGGVDQEKVAKLSEELAAAQEKLARVQEESSWKVQDATDKVAKAQDDLNKAVEKYGPNSEQAIKASERLSEAQENLEQVQTRVGWTISDAQAKVAEAQEKVNDALAATGPNADKVADAAGRLKAAQDDLGLAQERAQLAQSRYNETLMSTAAFAIPSVITMISSLSSAWGTLGPAVSGAVGGLSAAGAACAGLVAAGAAVIGTMVGLGASIVAWKDQTGEWHSATEKVIERLQGFPPVIKEVTEFLAKAAGGWLIAFDKLKEGAMGIGSALSTFAGQVSSAFGSAVSAVSSAVGTISSSLSGVASTVAGIWSSIISVIASGVSSIVSAVSSGFSSLIGIVQSIFSGIWNIITSILSGIVSYIQGAINSIISTFQSLWRAITGGSIWPEMFESMEKQAAEGMKGVQSVMGGGLGEITPMVRGTAAEAAAPTTRNITVNFTIQGVTDPDEVARQVENRIVEVLSRRSEVTAA